MKTRIETILKKSLDAQQLGRTEDNFSEVSVSPPFNLTKIQGILTSNLRTRKSSSDTPYMAFLRLEWEYETRSNKHSLEECARYKCQECEIPVIFRIKHPECNASIPHLSSDGICLLKPNLSKGDKVILEGEFSQSKDSPRPSFTCYSYQIFKYHE